jgi:hypothetical protein
MTIVAIIFGIFIVVWVLGVLGAGYHAYNFHYPRDLTIISFLLFLGFAGTLLLLVLNSFFSAYFGSL